MQSEPEGRAAPRLGFSFLLWTPELRDEHLPLLDELAAMGYDGVELPVVPTPEATLRRFAARCDELGLQRTAVGFATPEANPIARDASARAAAVEHLRTLVDKALLLGAEVLAGPIHSAYAEFTGEPPQADELAWSAETLRAAATHAADRGVQLGVEYLNRFECYLVTTAAETDALVRSVGHPAVCSVLDTHHSHIEDPGIDRALHSLAGTLGHVQLSESDRGVLGGGQVHWDAAFGALQALEYDGWLVVEAFSRHDPAFGSGLHVWRDPARPPLELAREALAFVRAGLARA